MAELQVGDVICVRTGSVIPVDGTVTSGEANINEASMTGEPLSVRKAKGSIVFAGGRLSMRAVFMYRYVLLAAIPKSRRSLN